jgi:hypothetical protein
VVLMMMTDRIESAPPLYTHGYGHIISPSMTRAPDPAAMVAGWMWREAAAHHDGSGYVFGSDRELRSLAALALIWRAASMTASGARGGGRHLHRVERHAVMSSAARAFHTICGYTFRVPRSPV